MRGNARKRFMGEIPIDKGSKRELAPKSYPVAPAESGI